MGFKLTAIWLVLVAGAAAIPLGIAKFHHLGGFAKSPQRVVLPAGASALVAGGRAKLWFGAVDQGAIVEVSCKGTTRSFELYPEETVGPVCGVRLRLVDVPESEVPRAEFEVSWDDQASG